VRWQVDWHADSPAKTMDDMIITMDAKITTTTKITAITDVAEETATMIGTAAGEGADVVIHGRGAKDSVTTTEEVAGTTVNFQKQTRRLVFRYSYTCILFLVLRYS
jgi:hypothetical protein